MTAFVTAGAGFLLAVLWLDLMFDVMVIGHGRDRELPEHVLASIAAYYRRVTTEAQPMSRLIAAVMVASTAALVVQLARGDDPAWVAVVGLVLVAAAIGLVATRTLHSARRLGSRRDPPDVQSRLARAVLRDHILCLALIAALLAIELGFAA
jgi:hypothetical protein